MLIILSRDCGYDGTCVLCIDCFQKSIHKDHQYKVSIIDESFCKGGLGREWSSGGVRDRGWSSRGGWVGDGHQGEVGVGDGHQVQTGGKDVIKGFQLSVAINLLSNYPY